MSSYHSPPLPPSQQQVQLQQQQQLQQGWAVDGSSADGGEADSVASGGGGPPSALATGAGGRASSPQRSTSPRLHGSRSAQSLPPPAVGGAAVAVGGGAYDAEGPQSPTQSVLSAPMEERSVPGTVGGGGGGGADGETPRGVELTMEMADEVELSGCLSKRRGGFMKHMHDWRTRVFVLHASGLLAYYEGERFEDAVGKMPRGTLLLDGETTSVSMGIDIDNAPTSYTLQVTTGGSSGGEKWKLCAVSNEDMVRWHDCILMTMQRLTAIESEKAPPSKITGGKMATPSGAAAAARAASASPDAGTPSMLIGASDARMSTRSYEDGSRGPDASPAVGFRPGKRSGFDPGAAASATGAGAGSLQEQPLQVQPHQQQREHHVPLEEAPGGGAPRRRKIQRPANRKKKGGGGGGLLSTLAAFSPIPSNVFTTDLLETALVLGIMNLAFALAPQLDGNVKLLVIVMLNFVVGRTVLLRSQQSNFGLTRLSPTPHGAHHSAAGTGAGAGAHGAKPAAALPLVRQRSSVTGGRTVQAEQAAAAAAAAAAGTSGAPPAPPMHRRPSSAEVGTTHASVNGEQIPLAGHTVMESPELPPNAPDHTWCNGDATQFRVRFERHGSSQTKEPSLPALFDLVALDFARTNFRIDHIGQEVSLPDTENIDTGHPDVPPLFIVNCQLPAGEPAMWADDDGEGFQVIFYFRIKQETCDALRNLDSASNAIKLFARWCAEAPNDPEMRGRFKAIAMIDNMDEFNLPSFIAGYNGKPGLIRRCATILRTPRYYEFDINVHKFAYVARKGLYTLTRYFDQMYLHIGFVIEGRDMSELPECLFGCGRVNKPQEDRAMPVFDQEEGEEEF